MSLSSFLPFVVVGITEGAVFGLAGVGLVLTYKTSRIFNFAYGGIATCSAFLFYFLHIQHGVDWPVAALISVLGVGIAMGLLFEVFARRLARCSLAMQITGSVGALVVIASVFSILYPEELTLPQYLPTSSFFIFGTHVQYNSLIVTIVSVVAAAGLYALLRLTQRGKLMRAVVDDPDLVSLSRRSPATIRRWSWIIGCTLASLSGVLIAPLVPLSPLSITGLVIEAFGAAAIGAFSSLPMTWVGGIIIGLLSAFASKYINSTGVLGGLPASMPFVVLFLVILVYPRQRLSAVKPILNVRHTSVWRAPAPVQVLLGVITLVVLIGAPAFAGYRITAWSTSLGYAIIVISVGMLARTSGQVCLCALSFAAIGAVAFAKLTGAGVPWLPSLIIAGLITVPIGALLAIPAIRLSGIYLALATLGFGFLLQNMFYQSNFMFGLQDTGLTENAPSLGWLTSDPNDQIYYAVLAVTVVIFGLVILLVRTRFGRLLRAMSDTSVALTAGGTNTVVTRVLAFCIASFFIAIGGALLGITQTVVTAASFPPFLSLTFVVIAMIVTAGEPWYAIIGGLGLGLIPAYFTSSNADNYLTLILGLGAVLAAAGGSVGLPVRLRKAIDDSSRVLMAALQRAWNAGFRHQAPAAVDEGGPDTGNRGPHPQIQPSSSVQHIDPIHQAQISTSLEGIEPRALRDLPIKSLEVEGLTVSFDGLVAVADLTLKADVGQITGLVGPNGSGKTTFFNACSGLKTPVKGTVTFGGKRLTRQGPSQRAKSGLGRTFQIMDLYESMTVRENVSMGSEAAQVGSRLLGHFLTSRISRRRIRLATIESLELCGIGDIADRRVSELSTGQRRLVELARCLAGSFDMLLLDEPSSGLDKQETARFSEILVRLMRARHIGIILVEHDVSLVLSLCDVIYVLDYGKLLFKGTPDEVRRSSIVRAAYLGTMDVEAMGAS